MNSEVLLESCHKTDKKNPHNVKFIVPLTENKDFSKLFCIVCQYCSIIFFYRNKLKKKKTVNKNHKGQLRKKLQALFSLNHVMHQQHYLLKPWFVGGLGGAGRDRERKRKRQSA